jgi:hypothetical protein
MLTVLFYRSVSLDELHDILHTKKFRISNNSLEGKFFAETLEEARAWGTFLTPQTSFALSG